jgi:thiamine pyrophosphokinase
MRMSAAKDRPGMAGPRHVLVFAGGERNPPEALADLPRSALVVAADSGADHALAAGWPVDVLVGDLDSLQAGVVAALEAAGTEVRRFPVAKDATDLALALDAALGLGATAVTVVGGHGGRLDHLLANVALLAAEEYAGVDLDARMGPARLTVVRGRRRLAGRPGELLTLLPVGGAARGVTTEGLLYPLRAATLRPGTTWGVSNQFAGGTAAVSVAGGVLVAVAPGELGPI